jgi:hypothetical protein
MYVCEQLFYSMKFLKSAVRNLLGLYNSSLSAVKGYWL